MIYMVLTNQRRQKLLFVLRVLLVIILLSLLLPKAVQLFSGQELLGSFNKEEKPSGNPMRVEHQEESKVVEPGLLDGLVQELHKYYRKDK